MLLKLRSLESSEEIALGREAIDRSISREEDRMASVEERLRGLVSLAAVAAAVTVGIGVAQLRGDLTSSATGTGLAVISVLAVIQLLCALLAAVKGLERRSFRRSQPEDLIPKQSEESIDRELRLVTISYNALIDLEEAANHKVEQMSVAYGALKNFVSFLLLASLLILVGQVLPDDRDHSSVGVESSEPH